MKRAPRLWILAVFFLSVVAMAASVQAQGRGPGGPGGPGRGPGGGFFGGGGGGVLSLLRSELVRTEVGVDEAAAQKIRTAAEEAMAQGRESREGMPNFREMSEQERQKAFEKMRAQMEERTKAIEKKVAEVIGPEKFKRLKEIEMQVAGVNALARPDVAAYLGLSEETKKKIEAAFEANRAEMGKIFQGARDMSETERAGLRGKMSGLREQLQKDVMALLSAQEKQKLGEMMGKPLSEEQIQQIQEQTRGGFGRPGDRGGNRGGDRGGNRGGDRGGNRGGDQGGDRPRRPA